MSETEPDHGYVCERCGGSMDDMVELVMHSDDDDCERPVRLSAPSLSRHERNAIIYAEYRLVDHGGSLVPEQMNDDDYTAHKLFQAAGLLEMDGMFDLVSFTDEAWDLVRDCRKMRADQGVAFDIGSVPGE